MGPGGKDIGGGPGGKKRARKGSRVDESDYDSYLDSVMSQLKNLPPVNTVEPRLHHFYNACNLYGCGEMPKTFGYDLNTHTGSLEGGYGNASLPNEGDYYNTMPFGPEPPVPNIKTLTITAKGFYNQEFEAKQDKKVAPPSTYDTPSPDLFYSSSPEPDHEVSTTPLVVMKGEKRKASKSWHDLEPDDSDDDETMINGQNGESEAKRRPPPQIIERPKSPVADLVVPIPIKPKPAQTITLNAVKGSMDKENKTSSGGTSGGEEDPVAMARAKSVLPVKSNGGITPVTITLGNHSNKSVLRVINGLSKLLKIDTPKQWLIEDKNGTTRDMFRCKIENGVDHETMETSMDLQTVLTSGARFCRHCDTVIQSNMVKKKTSDLTFLTRQEREEAADEMYFCNADCYFHFAIKRTNKEDVKDVKNLEELAEWQAKQKATIKKEQMDSDADNNAMDIKEDEGPKHKGVTYKTYSPLVVKKKYKMLSENELTAMMFQIGSTMMPPRTTDDTRECLFCHLIGDGPADGPARLLNYDVDKWVHLNCALWSEEVYETVSGALVNCETALKNGVNFSCKLCEKTGATVKCFKVRCTSYYHVGCATKDRATFYKNKSVFCNQHTLKGEKDQELTTLAVYRRVYIERDENRQVHLFAL
jgi:histone-lysine N-methyltransferase MLL3